MIRAGALVVVAAAGLGCVHPAELARRDNARTTTSALDVVLAREGATLATCARQQVPLDSCGDEAPDVPLTLCDGTTVRLSPAARRNFQKTGVLTVDEGTVFIDWLDLGVVSHGVDVVATRADGEWLRIILEERVTRTLKDAPEPCEDRHPMPSRQARFITTRPVRVVKGAYDVAQVMPNCVMTQ